MEYYKDPFTVSKLSFYIFSFVDCYRKIERFPAKSLATKMDSSHPLLNVRWEDINLLESLDAGAFGEVSKVRVRVGLRISGQFELCCNN